MQVPRLRTAGSQSLYRQLSGSSFDLGMAVRTEEHALADFGPQFGYRPGKSPFGYTEELLLRIAVVKLKRPGAAVVSTKLTTATSLSDQKPLHLLAPARNRSTAALATARPTVG